MACCGLTLKVVCRWVYSAHCGFKLYTTEEAWNCLEGRWIFSWGDSNHQDTLKNLLYYVLGCPDADIPRIFHKVLSLTQVLQQYLPPRACTLLHSNGRFLIAQPPVIRACQTTLVTKFWMASCLYCRPPACNACTSVPHFCPASCGVLYGGRQCKQLSDVLHRVSLPVWDVYCISTELMSQHTTILDPTPTPLCLFTGVL